MSLEVKHYWPNAVGHLYVFVSIHLYGQFEFAVETSLCEDAVQEGDEQPLVKLIVDATPIDGLSHQGLQSCPGYLVRCDVLTTLCVCVQTLK